MKEVAGQAASLLLRMAEARGVSKAKLTAGLPLDPSALESNERLDWEVYVELVDRFATELGGPEHLEQIGVEVSRTVDVHHEFKRVARLISSPLRLYQLNSRWGVTSNFRNMRSTCEAIGGGRLRVTITLDPMVRGSEASFHLAVGVLRGIPRLIGLREARVEVETLGAHSVTVEVTPPSSVTLWARANRAIGLLSGIETALDQLATQEQEIILQNRALRESEARWRSLAENAPGLILILERDGTIEASSRNAFKLAHQNVLELFEEGNRPGLIAALTQVFSTGEIEDLELRGVGAESAVWYECRLGPLIREGVITGATAIITDISEKKRTELALLERDEQLQQSQKLEAVGRLAGGIAHDFNNLLTVVLGYVDLLLFDLPPQAPGRTEMQEIRHAGERAAELTQQLLAFTRKQVMNPRVVRLDEVVVETRRMLERLLGEDVRLVIRTAPDLWNVKVDQARIEQVILNLAINSRDAMPSGGVLVIETANAVLGESDSRQRLGVVPGEYVQLVVHDEGTGMDRDTQTRIFEPFFTTKERGKGTGLGLATVRGIVQQSGGHVWVDSAVGKGTTFWIHLPRCSEATSRKVAAPPRSTHQGTETILLVEDDDQVRTLAREILEQHGYQVLASKSPSEALAMSRSRKFELLLTDVVMPEMNGRALANAALLIQPHLRVLYMSGYAEGEITDRGIVDPGLDLLEKPFTAATLTQRVRAVLDAHRDRRAINAD